MANEKYCGDALMQKTYTKDFRTHKSVKNTDLNMYFKENHHAAIVPKSDWLKVQEILSLRRDGKKTVRPRWLGEKFVAQQVKNGLLKGYYLLDPQWTQSERQQFLGIIQEILKNGKG